MKKLMKFSSLIMFIAVFSLMTTSCKKDTCYDCVGFDDGTTSLEDLGEICEGDDDGQGGTVDGDALNAAVALYEGFGGTCTKK